MSYETVTVSEKNNYSYRQILIIYLLLFFFALGFDNPNHTFFWDYKCMWTIELFKIHFELLCGLLV
jgi:hypothetical protein